MRKDKQLTGDTVIAALAGRRTEVEKACLENSRGDLQNIHLFGVIPLFLGGGVRGSTNDAVREGLEDDECGTGERHSDRMVNAKDERRVVYISNLVVGVVPAGSAIWNTRRRGQAMHHGSEQDEDRD